jgi:hypothetical protein
VAEKVREILEPYGEQDIEFSPPANKAFSSGHVDFNLPSELMVRMTEFGREKLSAAGLFSRLNIKGKLIKLGLINIEEKHNDETRDDQPLRVEDNEISQENGEDEKHVDI